MKSLILTAFAVLTLSAAIAPMAHALPGAPKTTSHSGPYDNTKNTHDWDYVGGDGN
jgi:hypothetical protein